MIKALFYKEWIKTRWILLLATIASSLLVVYAEMRIGKAVSMKGAAHIWEVLLTRETIFIQSLTYVPLFIGIALALFQFVPEMQQKRLKLTLHLPVGQQTILGTMLLFGASLLLLLFVLNFSILAVYLQRILAAELSGRILLSALPWYMAGLAAYGLTAWICLEPTWKRRILNALFMLAFLRLFFLSAVPEAYNGVAVPLFLLSLSTAGFPFVSVKRFKEGRQD